MTTPCWICGTRMDEIKVDPRDLKPAPCSECESVITQTVEEMNMDEQLEFPFDEPEPLDEDFDEDTIYFNYNFEDED